MEGRQCRHLSLGSTSSLPAGLLLEVLEVEKVTITGEFALLLVLRGAWSVCLVDGQWDTGVHLIRTNLGGCRVPARVYMVMQIGTVSYLN